MRLNKTEQAEENRKLFMDFIAMQYFKDTLRQSKRQLSQREEDKLDIVKIMQTNVYLELDARGCRNMARAIRQGKWKAMFDHLVQNYPHPQKQNYPA